MSDLCRNNVTKTLFMLLFFVSPYASAASVSFIMSESNNAFFQSNPDDYMKVTIDDSTGDVSFKIELLDALDTYATSNYGIDKFSFNYSNDIDFTTDAKGNIKEIVFDNSGWSASSTKKSTSEFGKFDIASDGTGNSRVDPLLFYITGIDGDTIWDYILPSTDKDSDGYYFAAHVGGLVDTYGGDKIGGSAYFSVSPIPLPGGVWLFGTAMVGMIGLRRRNHKNQVQ